MTSTMQLLEKALQVKKQAAWARDLNVTESAFSKARERKRLSPILAGTLAEQLHEDAAQWMALAAIEAEPDSPLKAQLLKKMEGWRKRLLSISASWTKRVGARGRRFA